MLKSNIKYDNIIFIDYEILNAKTYKENVKCFTQAHVTEALR